MADYVGEFIPEILSGKILDAKEKTHILGRLANRNYEGDLIYGNKVRIPQVGYPAVNSYTRNNFATGLTGEYANVADMYLTIDQEKYFDVWFDDVDIKQSKVPFMDAFAAKAGYKLADTQDTYIAGLYAQAGITTTSNSASTYVTLGSSNVKTQFLLMGKAFDKANIPRDQRWCFAPPELVFELTDAGILEQSNNDALWKAGLAPDAYGFGVYMSNNVSSTTAGSFSLLFGYSNESVTMAEQLNKVEAGRLQQQGFGYYTKGLHVYGARLIPDRTGVMYATISND